MVASGRGVKGWVVGADDGARDGACPEETGVRVDEGATEKLGTAAAGVAVAVGPAVGLSEGVGATVAGAPSHAAARTIAIATVARRFLMASR